MHSWGIDLGGTKVEAAVVDPAEGRALHRLRVPTGGNLGYDHVVGPVRAVAPDLVLEVAFDSVHRSTRHKSGLAMRFPRVHRIRWDKPAEEADRIESLAKLVT